MQNHLLSDGGNHLALSLEVMQFFFLDLIVIFLSSLSGLSISQSEDVISLNSSRNTSVSWNRLAQGQRTLVSNSITVEGLGRFIGVLYFSGFTLSGLAESNS